MADSGPLASGVSITPSGTCGFGDSGALVLPLCQHLPATTTLRLFALGIVLTFFPYCDLSLPSGGLMSSSES